MYPVNGSGSPVGAAKRKRIIVRRSRRLQRLVKRGASNQQITRVSTRLARSVNRSQRAGTYGGAKQRAVRRATQTLSRDSSLYSRRSARTVRRAVKRTPHPNRQGPSRNYPIGKQGSIGNPPRKPKKKPPHLNRPSPNVGSPGHPVQHHGPGKPHHGPGRPHQGHPGKPGKPGKPHHGKGPGKGPGKGKGEPKPIKLGKPGKKLAKRITKVTENRFLNANEKRVNQVVADFRKRRKYIVKHTKNPKREKKLVKIARKNMMQDVRKRGTGASPIYRKAGLAVSAELDPQLKALTSRIKQTKREKKRTAQDLKGLFQRALEQHQGYKGEIDTQSQASIQDTKDKFANLVDTIAGGYDQSTSSVMDELNRLGIGDAGAASTSALNRDKQYATSLARTAGAESTSEQKTNMEGYDQLMSLLGGEISATGLGARTEARQKFVDALMKYRDQRSALAATRLGKISTAAEALRASRAQAKSEALQNALARKMAQKNFQLDVAKFKSDRQIDIANLKRMNKADRRDYILGKLKYDLDRAKFFADNRGGGNNRKRKRQYSNSHTGAVDYLKDRGYSNSVVDLYGRVNSAAGNIQSLNGWANLPRNKDNQMIRYIMTHTQMAKAPPKLKRAVRNALQIEWGLV